jgi:hypothetical protein
MSPRCIESLNPLLKSILRERRDGRCINPRKLVLQTIQSQTNEKGIGLRCGNQPCLSEGPVSRLAS